MSGKRCADIGCFTGGLALLMAQRGAMEVVAIDEIPEHTEQCALLAEVFDLPNVTTYTRSLYELNKSEFHKLVI